jgi:uncharacterized protein (DUF1330 family)
VSALLIIQATVLDREPYRRYQRKVQPLIESSGGRLRASGMDLEVLEGQHDGRRLLVFEFPSMQAIRSFWESPEYASIRALRDGAARVDVWAVPAR